MSLKHTHTIKYLLAILAGLFMLSACGPRIDMSIAPEQIIAKTSERMQSLTGFSFLLDSTGAQAFLDEQHYYEFSQMEGDFTAPDRLQAEIRIITPGLVTDIKTICIGEQQYETNFATGAWILLPPNQSFDPMLLFNPETGVQSIANDLTDLKLEGLEELETMPSQKLYVVTGQLEGRHLYDLSYGMMTDGRMIAKLWIDPVTFDLYRMEMTEQTGSPDGEKIWVIEFWNIDETVEIEPPDMTADQP